MLQYYFNVNIPWIIFSAVFTAGAMFMMFRGVAVSTKLAGLLLRLRAAGAARRVGRRADQERRPPQLACRSSPATSSTASAACGRRLPAGHLPVHRLGELGGAGRGDHQPPAQRAPGRVPVDRRDGRSRTCCCPTPPSPGSSTTSPALNSAPIPFIAVAHSVAAWLAFIAYLAGLDLHPRRAHLRGELAGPADLQRRPRGPAAALDRQGAPDRGGRRSTRSSPSSPSRSAITLVWALGHLDGGTKQAAMSALNFFVDSSTMGTILIAVRVLPSNLALPFYYRKYRPAEFNVVKHVVLPVLGMIAVGSPDLLPVQAVASRRRSTGSRTRRSASSSCPSSTPSG